MPGMFIIGFCGLGAASALRDTDDRLGSAHCIEVADAVWARVNARQATPRDASGAVVRRAHQAGLSSLASAIRRFALRDVARMSLVVSRIAPGQSHALGYAMYRGSQTG